MIIGIDFDNTIASYDELMHGLAVEWGWVAAGMPKNKKLIRDALRVLPDGELKWRRLQTHCYGHRVCDARPMEGIKEFLEACRKRKMPVRVVSHKTEFAKFGDPTVKLRAAAIGWMRQEGLLNAERFGLSLEHVYFEETREDKIDRIRALGITHYVDDLVETFLEKSFPEAVEKILFSPRPTPSANGQWRAFPTWAQISGHLLTQ